MRQFVVEYRTIDNQDGLASIWRVSSLFDIGFSELYVSLNWSYVHNNFHAATKNPENVEHRPTIVEYRIRELTPEEMV